MSNKKLNEIFLYKGVKCILCDRDDTLLNIEGVLHHKGSMTCIDTKSCNRVRKKKIKKESK